MTFTTQAKHYIKRGSFISLTRCLDFMKHLWSKKLKNCSYETLEFEFVSLFCSNDNRTLERYLGRPERSVDYAGSTDIIRMNRTSGKIAEFQYYTKRIVPEKRGLLEILGYISKIKEGKETRYIIHHEKMSYFTEQLNLKTANSLPELEEKLGSSNDNSCVCSMSQPILQGKECEKTVWEVVSLVSPIETTGKKKEEEVIGDTHTNQSSESERSCFGRLNCDIGTIGAGCRDFQACQEKFQHG